MTQLLVRNLGESVKAGLRRLARLHGHSMEEEVRDILRNAVNGEDGAPGVLGTEIAGLFAKIGLDSDIPELRGYAIRPLSFGR